MATNTATSSTTHTGNGSTNAFAISFSFLADSEVDVTVAGVLKTINTHYTISGSTVTFTSGNTPANGATIKFQRDTDISAKKVDFSDGSVLTEADLDTNSDQVLFAQQEITDKLGGIEEGATGDQTAAEIRTLVESATDSNVFTDADQTKLNGIEAGATADQTDAEIRTAVENASDSNVFTDADHSKLNGIEAGATADQTNAEIRAAVEAASDSNVFTDADHSKLNGIEAGATADQTISEIKSLIAGSPLDASHLAANSVNTSELADDAVTVDKIADDSVGTSALRTNSVTSAKIDNNQITTAKIADSNITTAKIADANVTTAKITDANVTTSKIANNGVTTAKIADNAVTTGKIADAELKVLAGMQSGTASKLADSTALTSDIADLNQLDGMAKQTTITDDDTKFPTSGAIVDYVAAQLAPIGGLEVIATDAAFPNTQPAAGVVISIADAGGLVVDANGTSTTARTVGGTTVTINNFASNFNSSTVDAGVAIMVSSTGTGQVYNYHKATLKEADLLSLSSDINDFAARYRVTNGEPTSNNDEGDLIYDKQADKMKVFDSSTNAFKEVTSVGDFKFLFLCPAGGSGSPTINGSIATYDLREGSNSGSAASVTSAAQLIVSVNGVIQKPNTGTSAPSEGFALVDSNTIIFSSNLPSGAEVFVIQMGSAVSLQVPADGTVATAKLANGAVTTAKIVDDAVTTDKIADLAVTTNQIANNTITSQKINNNTIVNADINANAAINGSKFLDASISTAKLAADAVDGTKIADDSINSEHYVDGSIDTAHIADDAVTQAKMADNAIGTSQLANNAVYTAAIQDNAVVEAKIANNAVTNAKISGMAASKLTGALPAIDGSALTGLAAFPSGTKMLFAQSAAPTGWTHDTSFNNRALRLVSDSSGGSTGGSNTWSSVLNSSVATSGGSVANHTLTTSQIPSHNHSVSVPFTNGQGGNMNATFGARNDQGSTNVTSGSTGGGQGHNHGFTNPSFNLDLRYLNVIVATKN